MKRKDKKKLIRILAAGALFVLSFAGAILHGYVGIAILLASYITAGYDVLYRAVRGIFNGQVFDENFLMAIATVGAVFTGEYHEAVFVMVFYQVGELFQSIAIGKSRRSISALMDLRPDTATVVQGDSTDTVDPCEVAVGDIIEVRPGEKVPLDGVVISGASNLNTVALTGESAPQSVSVGDSIMSGCVNIDGVIRVRVTAAFSESTVSKILELVENSTANKSKSEAFITRFARYYTPAVVIAAVCLAVIPPLLTGAGSLSVWQEWVYRAMTFLVISCPCALVISVPLTFFGGIGCASRHGILVKGSNYLELLSKCTTVVLDKTGTLTKGTFEVSGVYPEGVDRDTLMALAACAECKSNHPIAQAIVKMSAAVPEVDEYTELAGLGVKVLFCGKTVYAGNAALMQTLDITAAGANGGTAVHVACDGKYCGYIMLSDVLKPDSREAIEKLGDIGVKKTVMLTGDKKDVAYAVAAQAGVDEVYAELLPADKVTITERLIAEGETVAFVGDGINDAPVLARADVGIAMGGIGSDAAIEAADIVLMDDSPTRIPQAMAISRFTRAVVKQNIIFVFIVKALTLILGAVGIANMWMAVFADVGVAVIAILNAIRTMKKEM